MPPRRPLQATPHALGVVPRNQRAHERPDRGSRALPVSRVSMVVAAARSPDLTPSASRFRERCRRGLLERDVAIVRPWYVVIVNLLPSDWLGPAADCTRVSGSRRF